MGLDISAYRKLTKIDCHFDADGEPIDKVTGEPIEGEYTRIYVNDDFPGRAEPLEHKGVYAYEERAGSNEILSMGYGRYNHWRDELAQLAGYPPGEYEKYGRMWPSYCIACWEGAQGPFAELINFSDCEGTIGPVVAAKLAKDFADFDARARERGDEFYKRYAGLKRGCEMAADGGALRFH